MKRRIDSRKKPENVNVLFYSTLLNNHELLSSLPGRSSCPFALASAVNMSAGIMSLVISRGGFIASLFLLATGGAFIVVGRFFFRERHQLIIRLSTRLCNVHHVSNLLYRLAATRSWFRRFIHHDLSGQRNNCVVRGCGVSLRSTRDQGQPRRNRRNTFHCSSAASLDGQREGSLSRCLGACRPSLNRVG